MRRGAACPPLLLRGAPMYLWLLTSRGPDWFAGRGRPPQAAARRAGLAGVEKVSQRPQQASPTSRTVASLVELATGPNSSWFWSPLSPNGGSAPARRLPSGPVILATGPRRRARLRPWSRSDPPQRRRRPGHGPAGRPGPGRPPTGADARRLPQRPPGRGAGGLLGRRAPARGSPRRDPGRRAGRRGRRVRRRRPVTGPQGAGELYAINVDPTTGAAAPARPCSEPPRRSWTGWASPSRCCGSCPATPAPAASTSEPDGPPTAPRRPARPLGSASTRSGYRRRSTSEAISSATPAETE